MLPDLPCHARLGRGRRCARMPPVMTDREVILDVLRRVARRLWFIRALQEVGFGLSVGLFSLLAFRLVWPALAGDSGPPNSAMLALAVAGSSAYALWLAVHRATLAQAAGAAAVDAELDRIRRIRAAVAHLQGRS